MDCPHSKVVRVKVSDKYRAMTGEFQRKYVNLEVPCGMCIACRIAKTREWKMRLMMEKEDWSKSGFLTLTYDDDHLPLTACGNMTLMPKHLTDFFKRARKFNESRENFFHGFPGIDENSGELKSPPLLRYFACGEYGDHTGRSHYHAVIYGFDSSDTEELQKLWPFGFVRIDDLNEQRAGYVAGYVQKKIYRDPAKYWKEYGCRVWPFQRQSQGLGLSYYWQHADDYAYWNYRPRLRGVSYSMPRYFSKKDEHLNVALSIIGERQKALKLIAEQEAIDKGYDIVGARRQQEVDLLKKVSLRKKGKL